MKKYYIELTSYLIIISILLVTSLNKFRMDLNDLSIAEINNSITMSMFIIFLLILFITRGIFILMKLKRQNIR